MDGLGMDYGGWGMGCRNKVGLDSLTCICRHFWRNKSEGLMEWEYFVWVEWIEGLRDVDTMVVIVVVLLLLMIEGKMIC